MITKRQHYVWRQYLRAWTLDTSNDAIWTYFLKDKEIRRVNLMGVAQQHGFYKLEVITCEDAKYLTYFVNQFKGPIQKLGYTILQSYIKYSELSSMSKNRLRYVLREGETSLKEIEMNLIEHLHGRYEKFGSKLLNCKSAIEFKEYVNDDDNKLMEVFSFLCIQYMRTEKMRVSISQAPAPFDAKLMNKAFPLISVLMGLAVAFQSFLYSNSRFIFLHNNSGVSLLSSDQPIINASADEVDKDGHCTKWELYYPLSPKLALYIDQTGQGYQYMDMAMDEKMVTNFNEKIFRQAQRYIFSDSKQSLESFIKR